jgi:hypothetical protein
MGGEDPERPVRPLDPNARDTVAAESGALDLGPACEDGEAVAVARVAGYPGRIGIAQRAKHVERASDGLLQRHHVRVARKDIVKHDGGVVVMEQQVLLIMADHALPRPRVLLAAPGQNAERGDDADTQPRVHQSRPARPDDQKAQTAQDQKAGGVDPEHRNRVARGMHAPEIPRDDEDQGDAAKRAQEGRQAVLHAP